MMEGGRAGGREGGRGGQAGSEGRGMQGRRVLCVTDTELHKMVLDRPDHCGRKRSALCVQCSSRCITCWT